MATLDSPTPTGAPLATEPLLRPEKRRLGSTVGKTAGYVAMVVAAAGLLLPFVWMIVSSLKTNNQVFTVPVQWVPDPVVWQNYLDIWTRSDMTTWLGNTLLLSVGVTFLRSSPGASPPTGSPGCASPGATCSSWSTSAPSPCRGSRT